MDHVHRNDTKENDQATEAADDFLNTFVNESIQVLKLKTLNAIEIVRYKEKNIMISHDYIIKT